MNEATASQKLDTKLLKAIGVQHLTTYFEYLDDLRESGDVNMFMGASMRLQRKFKSMGHYESSVIVQAWLGQSLTLPPEDRACNVIPD